MEDSELNIEWLNTNYGDFLIKFGLGQNEINKEYSDWLNNNAENSLVDFLLNLFRLATLHVIKKAATEQEYYNWKLELDSKIWECSVKFKKPDSNYHLQQIHFDKLMISYLTLPFKFLVQIDSNDCCSYCSKKKKKNVTFEQAIKNKYLPFSKCSNGNGCKCTYSIVPILTED